MQHLSLPGGGFSTLLPFQPPVLSNSIAASHRHLLFIKTHRPPLYSTGITISLRSFSTRFNVFSPFSVEIKGDLFWDGVEEWALVQPITPHERDIGDKANRLARVVRLG